MSYFDRTIKEPRPEHFQALLEALKMALTALNTAPRFRVPCLGIDSYAIAAHCESVIKKAETS